MGRNEKPSGKGKIKFRFIEFEMDGGDATLQDAIRELTRAVGRPQPKLLATGDPNRPKLRAGDENAAEDVDIVAADQPSEADTAEEDANSGDRDREPSKPRRLKTPTIVNVDLRSGDIPLKEFLGRAEFNSDAKRYMAIAYWFKTHRDTSEVTPDLIYTAYKHMGWTTIPKDVGGPLRALKRDGSFEKGSGGQAYKLNHIGEGKIEEMLNKSTPNT